ncbi:MAG: DNA alkylation repair enzyme [Synergistetes bacterium ADurb.Bin155]|jgi:3-methyladenine DNA glycosylase AlkD|nr:DNA alkylation repair protein [Synergistales bacterium]NMD18430.1 DNA alkylation repair protein [Synergistaceae bacterium]OQB44770.1 MAG: DNA alkylation repair enzyme [Synergistetes bacterium ADurb.Bin155]MBP8996373.1 DNA alkylation repair protein [Synergistales bacterium]HOC81796.1 DNA alkylation repair protein [Synergistales bacterium]
MDTKKMARRIREDLLSLGDETLRSSTARFFREDIKCHGIRSAPVRKYGKMIVKEASGQRKEKIFELCELLWRGGYLEETFIACHLTESRAKEFEKADIRLFQHWVGSCVTNWASCDTFCNHSVAMLLDKYPENIGILKKEWVTSPNRWLRRGAAVSLVIPARRGEYLEEVMEIASILLLDNDDLVQKGYGWMLKAASEFHRQEIFEFIMGRKDIMPRTALRYGIEKMPPEMRKMVMDRARG